MMPRIDITKLFLQVYEAYPARIVNRNDIELSNNIILPPSALDFLTKNNNRRIKKSNSFSCVKL